MTFRYRKIQVTCSSLNRKPLAAPQSRSGSPEAQEMQKQLDPPCLLFLQELHHVATTDKEITTHLEPVFELTQKLRKRRLTLLVIWAKGPTLGICSGEGLALDQFQTKWFEKSTQCPNILIRKLFKVCSTLLTSIKHYGFFLIQILFLSKLQSGVITEYYLSISQI